MARATSSFQGYAERIDPADLARVRGAARSLGWIPAARRPPPPARALIPERPLKFGEYLFHAGRVSWRDVLAAVKWQRAQRPMAGEIAVQLGHLTREAVRELLATRARERALHVPFCEYARGKGFLSDAQRTAILGRQRAGQRRIGEYFRDQGLLDPEETERLASEHWRHNVRARWARVPAPRPAAAPQPPAPPKRR